MVALPAHVVKFSLGMAGLPATHRIMILVIVHIEMLNQNYEDVNQKNQMLEDQITDQASIQTKVQYLEQDMNNLTNDNNTLRKHLKELREKHKESEEKSKELEG